MDYNEYEIIFYKDQRGKIPILEFLKKIDEKSEAKISQFIEYLSLGREFLRSGYCKHIIDKIWELKVDFSSNCFRVFYFVFVDKKIVLLHIFLKKTNKTPKKEIERALNNYKRFLKYYYEKEK